MVVIMRPDATESDINTVVQTIKNLGMGVHISKGKERTLIGIIGDEREIDFDSIAALNGVERAFPILKPYKYVDRNVRPEGKVINVEGVEIGRGLVFMAGPCSVEDEDTMLRVAEEIRKAGATIFRAGAYKPRTSPWSFQGLREKGLEILSKVKRATGLVIVTEVMDSEDIQIVGEHADIYQVGMRNMKNYTLLSKLGHTTKPVLLKRGDSSTLEEWLAAADYIVRNGNENVILCERGIRTFETYTRNTLDINAVPVLKELTHLPIIVDPSHATGKWNLVSAVSRAAVAAGADGLIIEVHPHPEQALSDGGQSLRSARFADLMTQLARVAEAVGRRL